MSASDKGLIYNNSNWFFNFSTPSWPSDLTASSSTLKPKDPGFGKSQESSYFKEIETLNPEGESGKRNL